MQHYDKRFTPNKKIQVHLPTNVITIGAALCIGLYDPQEGKVTICDIGDCKAILIDPENKKHVLLSLEHRPNLDEERTRIERAGGIRFFLSVFFLNNAIQGKVDEKEKRIILHGYSALAFSHSLVYYFQQLFSFCYIWVF